MPSFSMRAFLTAVQFLTRIPVPGGAMSGTMEDYQQMLRASVVYFPIVGGCIGLVTGLLFVLFSQAWVPMIAAALALAIEAILTGAFHEDALADSADGLGGGWTREQVLEIMKDSRHGTYGVVALVLGLFLRVATISVLPVNVAFLFIAFSSSIGRWAILLMMHWIPAITDRETLVKDVGSQASFQVVQFGAIVPLALGVVLCFVGYLASVVLAVTSVIVVVLLLRNYFQKRLGGVTGDLLGCTCYLAQLVALLAATAKFGN
jgi:adenosylcobinamide-GDP ribazoletransferase